MATLLHFLKSLAISLWAGFVLALSVLVGGLSGLAIAKESSVDAIAQPLYDGMREFLAAFGGGSCWDGTIAIALAVGVVSALWRILSGYKHKQKNIWRLAAADAFNASSTSAESLPKLR